jgi:hypothetical protein
MRGKLVAFFLLASICRAAEQCSAARDEMVRALERVTARATNDELEDALQLLKQSTGQCPSLGDAWYYRSLFERKLGHTRLADYSAGKAELLGSEARDQRLDPFTLAAPPGEPPSKRIRDKWAVVVGIAQFRDPRLNLTYPGKDARDFAAVLTNPKYGRFNPDHVHLLTDGDATTVRIKTELNWLARMAKPDDLALIYLSSHGSPHDKDIADVNYIYTYDTNVADKEDGLYATALPMVEVANVVRNRIKARHATVFLDTCHSAGMLASGMPSASASQQTLDRFREGVGRVIITSSQESEKSYESDDLQNGYFTYFLIDALKKGNGLTPVAQIYTYVKTQVSKRVQQVEKVTQTPVMSVSDQAADVPIGIAPDLSTAALLLLPFAPRVRGRARALRLIHRASPGASSTFRTTDAGSRRTLPARSRTSTPLC